MFRLEYLIQHHTHDAQLSDTANSTDQERSADSQFQQERQRDIQNDESSSNVPPPGWVPPPKTIHPSAFDDEWVGHQTRQVSGSSLAATAGETITDDLDLSLNSDSAASVSSALLSLNLAQAAGALASPSRFLSPLLSPKTPEQMIRLRKVLNDSYMFQHLEATKRQLVVESMREVEFEMGEVVIMEGEDSEYCYVIETGFAECYKQTDGIGL